MYLWFMTRAGWDTPLLRLGRTLTWLFAAALLTGCAGYQSIDATYVEAAPSATTGAGETTDTASTATPDGAPVQDKLVAVYRRYQGAPYLYGGASRRGFDCSGFIMTAFREGLGRSIPRTTQQMLAAGRFVRRDQLQAGDVVFFRFGGKEQHAGIYLGDDRFIHSSSSTGVTESSLDSPYWRQRYTQARRFL